MQIVICPGMHPVELTEHFVKALQLADALVFSADQPVYSGWHILKFLLTQLGSVELGNVGQAWDQQALQTPILLIGFSAGTVGAIGAAYLWQILGGRVTALVAIDGWGVPLFADFPIHRISHDRFTHWSSALLGTGQASFYAEPAVAHLDLWQTPQSVQGWAVQPSGWSRTTAAQFLQEWLQHYRHQEA